MSEHRFLFFFFLILIVVASFPKLSGFKHKELRGKLAIGITANFINRNTAEEAQVAEISGVARIYNQKFFQDLLTQTGTMLVWMEEDQLGFFFSLVLLCFTFSLLFKS